jgi:hypothetical protein
MDSQLNKQLKQIEALAENKQGEIENNYYKKYRYLYDILINFLKNKEILIYGGLAINEQLPAKSKFYGKYELPDIDIFTFNAKLLIKDILNHYKKEHNIQLISAKEALHENTYKLFAEGLQLLDITDISKEDYDKLNANAVDTKIGIRAVDIRFLKYTLHLLSSQSYDAHRWTKVYERILKVYKHYPVKEQSIPWKEFYTPIPEELYQGLQHWISREKIISFGWDVIETTLKSTQTQNGFPITYLLYDGNVKQLAKQFKWSGVKIVETYPGDIFVAPYVALGYNNTRFCYIFNTRSCLSIIKENDEYRLTLHSLITMLYTLYLSSQSTDFLPAIENLSNICMKDMKRPSKLSSLYSAECYGSQSGIITLRRKRLIRYMKNKNVFKQ